MPTTAPPPPVSEPGLPSGPLPERVDPQDPAGLSRWCQVFGVTAQQLVEAVLAVGSEPGAVREHLLNQGSSAGVG